MVKTCCRYFTAYGYYKCLSLLVVVCFITSRIFLGLFWGRILAPPQFIFEQNLPIMAIMVYMIPNFLVIHFGENFVKIQTKIPKLQMHENLHKNVNETMFHI